MESERAKRLGPTPPEEEGIELDRSKPPTQERNDRIIVAYQHRLQEMSKRLEGRDTQDKSLQSLLESIKILQEMLDRVRALNMTNPPESVAPDIEALGRSLTITEQQVEMFAQ